MPATLSCSLASSVTCAKPGVKAATCNSSRISSTLLYATPLHSTKVKVSASESAPITMFCTQSNPNQIFLISATCSLPLCSIRKSDPIRSSIAATLRTTNYACVWLIHKLHILYYASIYIYIIFFKNSALIYEVLFYVYIRHTRIKSSANVVYLRPFFCAVSWLHARARHALGWWLLNCLLVNNTHI